MFVLQFIKYVYSQRETIIVLFSSQIDIVLSTSLKMDFCSIIKMKKKILFTYYKKKFYNVEVVKLKIIAVGLELITVSKKQNQYCATNLKVLVMKLIIISS